MSTYSEKHTMSSEQVAKNPTSGHTNQRSCQPNHEKRWKLQEL